MAIAWTVEQRVRVQRVLRECPVDSGRCEQAASRICPIARERDPSATRWRMTPAEGRFVLPAEPEVGRWYFHVTVEAEAHCVDALTGPGGTMRSEYLERHWRHGDAIRWEALP
ncbi:MAG: hypothetical protein KBG48_08090 [Kofleriaceae bacterium]|jgi:hypothetical protein|nr:hypothetical protein [Kofleriaceae bacterium]MBP9167331.1 hypothetical protein [Kofleriaceae bacterium]MBP9859880.1 hypothetical protein [Kofleriaceae bacterium]